VSGGRGEAGAEDLRKKNTVEGDLGKGENEKILGNSTIKK